MSKRKKIHLVIVLFLLMAAGGVIAVALQQVKWPGREIPTTRVKRGDLDVKVYTAGELRSVRSTMLVAPSVGSSLRIIDLAETGGRVKKGDVVVEFDPSDQEHNLEQARYDLRQAQQSIAKARADAAVQSAQDGVDLLKATFDVRRADLDVSRNELVSTIDAQKNLLTLDEAKRRLAQLKEDIPSHAVSNLASIAVAREKLVKARLAINQAERKIESMRLRSPQDGLVVVRENRQASGGVYSPGMRLPGFREGDEVQPGNLVAQVLDISQMEIQGEVSETARANLNEGDPAEIRVYALPAAQMDGKVKAIAGMAMRNGLGMGGAMSKFEVFVQLDKPDPELRPGLTAQVIISGGQMKGVLYLSSQAVFEKDSDPVVYVKKGGVFVPQQIKILRRSETQVALEGLREGTEVALVNPEAQSGKSTTRSGPISPSLRIGGF